MATLHHLRRALTVLAVPALLAAGCGGSPSNGNQTGQNSDAQALKWVQCMQQHGVNASESNNGQSTAVRAPTGSNSQQGPSQQQVQAAQQACKQYEPNGGKSSGQPSAQELDRNAKYAQCMTEHGIPTQAQGGGVNVNVPPGTDPSKAQQAEQACQHYRGGSAVPVGHSGSNS